MPQVKQIEQGFSVVVVVVVVDVVAVVEMVKDFQS